MMALSSAVGFVTAIVTAIERLRHRFGTPIDRHRREIYNLRVGAPSPWDSLCRSSLLGRFYAPVCSRRKPCLGLSDVPRLAWARLSGSLPTSVRVCGEN